MKVVINKCFGGFGLSKEAYEWLAKHGHKDAKKELADWKKRDGWVTSFLKTGKWPKDAESKDFLEIDAKYHKGARFFGHASEFKRDDPLLVKAVEALGDKANGEYAELKVVEVPDGVDYEIGEYDGREHIAEKHRTWA